MFTNQCTAEKMKEACRMASNAINELSVSLHKIKEKKCFTHKSKFHK